MRKLGLIGAVLVVGAGGMVGCGPRVQPAPVVQPPPPDPLIEQKKAAAKYQEEIVMAEVARTHPVLTATVNKDLYRLRAELRKAPNRVNEVRRDMRLGPPLREACRLRWREGVVELLGRGAKCLGDAQCESCARSVAATMGPVGGADAGAPPGSGTPPGPGRQTVPARQPPPAEGRPLP